MRGRRKVGNARMIRALEAAPSQAAAARELGCSVMLIHKRAQEEPKVAAALEGLRARRAKGGKRAPSKAAEATRAAIDDRELAQAHAKAGLEVLRKLAEDPNVAPKDRVNAARYLVSLAAPAPPAEKAGKAEPEDQGGKAKRPPKPLTSEEVAARLRFKA